MPKYKNNYFVIRHGKSQANEENIIVSLPLNGINGYGLSDTGIEQVKMTAKQIKNKVIKPLIISSDFKRAKETAQILIEELEGEILILDTRLRERYFGEYEKQNNSNYRRVWEEDRKNFKHKIKNVESCQEVFFRINNLFLELESKYEGKEIILVSHGDILQIFLTGLKNLNLSRHRELESIKTAEIIKI